MVAFMSLLYQRKDIIKIKSYITNIRIREQSVSPIGGVSNQKEIDISLLQHGHSKKKKKKNGNYHRNNAASLLGDNIMLFYSIVRKNNLKDMCLA